MGHISFLIVMVTRHDFSRTFTSTNLFCSQNFMQSKSLAQVLFISSFFIFFALKPLVSTLEKRSKKSPSPSTSVTTSNINTITHDDDVKITATSVASDSHSVLANSLDLSSDDDHLDKLTSSTTTSSSLFDTSKRVSSFDDGLKPLSIVDQMKSSNTSINKLDFELDSAGNDTSMRYRVEQQRKGSIPNINNNQVKVGNENKVILMEL
jgi:hypothetical protein